MEKYRYEPGISYLLQELKIMLSNQIAAKLQTVPYYWIPRLCMKILFITKPRRPSK